MTKVAVTSAACYDTQAVCEAMQTLLGELGGITAFVSPGEKVLIKTNMLEAVPQEKGVTTHPEVIRALIRQVKAAGGIPMVGDSPGVSSTLRAAEKCGILAVCQEEETELICFEDKEEVVFPEGKTLKRFTLAAACRQADKIISAAKMKTHSFMGITGGVKNLFGLIVGTDKAQFHLRMKKRADFAGMLVDLALLTKPVLYIIDGIVAMEGQGPRNGTLRSAGVLLGSSNGFAADLVMTEIMGGGTMPVNTLALARGLTPPLREIEIVGSGRQVRYQFQKPRHLESTDHWLPVTVIDFFQNQLTARPQISSGCIACGRCVEVCPPKAIKKSGGSMEIAYEECIRCYCCQELCPADAVELKKGWLLQLIDRLRR